MLFFCLYILVDDTRRKSVHDFKYVVLLLWGVNLIKLNSSIKLISIFVVIVRVNKLLYHYVPCVQLIVYVFLIGFMSSDFDFG